MGGRVDETGVVVEVVVEDASVVVAGVDDVVPPDMELT